jgi:type II secretion system protein I
MKSIVNLKNNAGFTLLEVLVALGILAVSITAILQMFGTAMVSSSRAEAVTVGTMLARQKMAEQMIKLEKDALEGKFPGTDEESDGSFDEPYDKYKWHVKVRKVEIPMPPQSEQGAQAQMMQMISKQIGDNLREIKLDVTWDELGETQDISVTTHVVKK